MHKIIFSIAALFVCLIALSAALVWHLHQAGAPTAIILASVQSDTLDGLNGVDPIAPELRERGYKVYSIDLPCHYSGMTENGLECWSQRIGSGEIFLLRDFCADVSALIDKTGADNVQMVGISRGGYVAFECAALDERVSDIAQVAPVVDLYRLREFDGLPRNPELSLDKYVERLKGRNVLIRIGRADDRVGTDLSVDFAEKIGAEIHLLDTVGHRAPDPEGLMATWLMSKWREH